MVWWRLSVEVMLVDVKSSTTPHDVVVSLTVPDLPCKCWDGCVLNNIRSCGLRAPGQANTISVVEWIFVLVSAVIGDVES